jgi:hypothetical protein
MTKSLNLNFFDKARIFAKDEKETVQVTVLSVLILLDLVAAWLYVEGRTEDSMTAFFTLIVADILALLFVCVCKHFSSNERLELYYAQFHAR